MNDEVIKFNESMIDLETLGIKRTSAFISVGMVKFNTDFCKVDYNSTYYKNIDWASALKERTYDISTLQFWLSQGKEASQILLKDCVPLDLVGMEICDYTKGTNIWSNGATFDIVMLEDYFKHRTPWKYWQARDFRTISAIGKDIFGYSPKEKPFKGIKHYALDDAIYQAEYVCEVIAMIKDNAKS